MFKTPDARLPMQTVLSLAPDLMIRSKIDVAARHYGVEVRHVANGDAFMAVLDECPSPPLVLVDLDLPGEETVSLVRHARDRNARRIVGFCSHVMTDLIRESRAAGAHSVMPNSTFAASITGLMAEVANRTAGEA